MPTIFDPIQIARPAKKVELNEPDPSTFYASGPRGYTDYPAMG